MTAPTLRWHGGPEQVSFAVSMGIWASSVGELFETFDERGSNGYG